MAPEQRSAIYAIQSGIAFDLTWQNGGSSANETAALDSLVITRVATSIA